MSAHCRYKLSTTLLEPVFRNSSSASVSNSSRNYLKIVSTQLLANLTTSTGNSKLDSSSSITFNSDQDRLLKKSDNKYKALEQNDSKMDEYNRAIQDLNLLQSNTQVIALAKYKNPEEILPLFRRQLQLSGLKLEELDKLNVVHISGTKGKGSTCAFTESILRRAGLKTGFYNSPHLIKVTERIQLNGAPIDDKLFAKYFRQVYDRLTQSAQLERVPMPSYFSFLTILAFHVFLEEKVDCAVIEVGMGGQYDPTNVIERPRACAITTLDFDHTSVLGNTIESIAWSKAGIIKPGVPVFTIDHEQKEAMRVIMERARDNKAQLHVCKPIDRIKSSLNLGIQSSAQYANAALACQLASTILNTSVNVDDDALPAHFREGLEQCSWPGRCQIIELNDRLCFFLDGAHTKKSMQNCLDWFKSSSQARNSNAQQILMVNVIGERDKAEVLRPLGGYTQFTHAIFSTNRINSAGGDALGSDNFVNMQGPNSERSLDNVRSNVQAWESLAEKKSNGKIIMKPNTHDSFETIKQLAGNRVCHVLATGSLHFIGAVIETISLFSTKSDHDNK